MPTIDSLDALFETPAELETTEEIPANEIDMSGDEFEIRMATTVGTIIYKC